MRNAVDLAVALVTLGETNPRDPLLIAVRAAIEVTDARREHRRAVIETTNDVRAGWKHPTGRSYRELQRRRAEPGPMAAERRSA